MKSHFRFCVCHPNARGIVVACSPSRFGSQNPFNTCVASFRKWLNDGVCCRQLLPRISVGEIKCFELPEVRPSKHLLEGYVRGFVTESSFGIRDEMSGFTFSLHWLCSSINLMYNQLKHIRFLYNIFVV